MSLMSPSLTLVSRARRERARMHATTFLFVACMQRKGESHARSSSKFGFLAREDRKAGGVCDHPLRREQSADRTQTNASPVRAS